MHTTCLALFLLVTLPARYTAVQASPFPGASQGRRALLRGVGTQGRREGDQTERITRRLKLGRDGRVSISNIAGEIVVSAGSGDEMSIDAVKRTRGRDSLDSIRVDIDERPGRVDIRTTHARGWGWSRGWVDYMVIVPASASLDLRSISGNVKVSGVRGIVRTESVSGNVTMSDTPRVELAKTVSGNVELSDVSTDGDLSAASISGMVRGRSIKARTLSLTSVSGDAVLNDVSCDRFEARSVSGNIEYFGALARGGRYEVRSHSGTVRFGLSGDIGFELDARSFSGSVQSQFPVTLTSEPRRRFGPGGGRSLHSAFGDGSATIDVTTFSGDVVITRR